MGKRGRQLMFRHAPHKRFCRSSVVHPLITVNRTRIDFAVFPKHLNR